jgi:hypothetical protein
MKGAFITDMWWTFLFLLVIVFVGTAFIMFGFVSSGMGLKDSISSVNFINEANKPFLVAEVLQHYKVSDRQFMEHALQTVVTGSAKNSNSLYATDFVRKFLENYEMNYYSVSIKDKNKNDLIAVSNIDTRCGENTKGICVDAFVSRCSRMTIVSLFNIPLGSGDFCESITTKYGICGNGRVKIDDVQEDCQWNEVCCMENKDSSDHNLDGDGNVLPNCGLEGNKKGVCDDEKILVLESGLFTNDVLHLYGCREGRNRIEKQDNDCGGPEPEICCVPRSDTSDFSILTEANIPILYKKKMGYVEVITGA